MTKRLEVGKEYWFKGKVVYCDKTDKHLPFQVRIDCFNEWISAKAEAVEAIPEREKVTIPKFVAEWIEEVRPKAFSLLDAYTSSLNSEELKKWLLTKSNFDVFARAWLDGYEVEKEPLYTVEIPDPNCINATTYLEKMGDGKVTINGAFYYDCVKDNDWKRRDSAQLTESEITEDFERAWQFAEPVEE